MPNPDSLKSAWIESISKHQRVGPSFMVCERHFKPEDFRIKGRKKSLNSEAIPSIFDDEPVSVNCNASIQKSTGKIKKYSKYCKIKHCKYEVGTRDEKILFFR